METAHRRKRRNCGSSGQGHHSTGLGSMGQLGLGVMLVEESPSHFGPVFSGIHSVMNQGGRLDSRSLQFNGFESGNNTTARFPFSDGIAADGWNTVLPGSVLHQPSSSYVGSSSDSSYPCVGDQGRNSYKRKSSMDTYPDSLTYATSSGMGENGFLRFTQGPGARQSDTSLNSVSGLRRDGQGAFHSGRTNALPVDCYEGLTTLTQDNYYRPSIIQNERGPRRILSRSDTINESVGNRGISRPDALPFSQGNGLSAIGSWRRNNTVTEEGSNQSGLNFTSIIEGNHLRPGEASNLIDIASIDTRPLQLPSREMRPAHFREFTPPYSHLSHGLTPNPYPYVGTANIDTPSFPASHSSNRYDNIFTQVVLPPPGSNGLTAGPQTFFGDLPSGSIHGQHGQFLPRYNDTSRASFLRQGSLRGSRVLPSDGVNRQRFSASHNGWPSQLLAYEWADAYDQHSDMRLDVDNMSYEELLALEERIGNVNTGLKEDNIQKCLKVSTRTCSDVTVVVDSQECDSKCTICQEEYTEGDELGELQCGHGYHTDCIKQWLLLKNQCPICKAAAY